MIDFLSLNEGDTVYFFRNSIDEFLISKNNNNSSLVSSKIDKCSILVPEEISNIISDKKQEMIFTLDKKSCSIRVQEDNWKSNNILYFEKYYEPKRLYKHNTLKEPLKLGEVGQCRFCKKKLGEVTFDKKAHAVSQLLGNNFLLSNDECDVCNQLFSNYESELGHYLHFWRSAALLDGKRGVPKFKEDTFKMGKSKTGKLLIKEQIDKESKLQFDEENKAITITGIQKSYIPHSVYKALVKMAISFVEEEELHLYSETIEWLLDSTNTIRPNSRLIMWEQFISHPNPYPEPEILQFTRLEENESSVYNRIFIIAFSNYVFQIYIPLCSLDKRIEFSKVQFLAFPSNYTAILPLNRISIDLKDFSDTERKRGEKISIEYSYDEKIEINPSNLNTSDSEFS